MGHPAYPGQRPRAPIGARGRCAAVHADVPRHGSGGAGSGAGTTAIVRETGLRTGDVAHGEGV